MEPVAATLVALVGVVETEAVDTEEAIAKVEAGASGACVLAGPALQT